MVSGLLKKSSYTDSFSYINCLKPQKYSNTKLNSKQRLLMMIT